MNANVYWTLELGVQPGRQKDLQVLMAEMVGATQANEPGTLNYEWSTSADGKLCTLFERYLDSDAAMIHIGTFGKKYAGRFFEILKPVRFTIYGTPSATVKAALAASHPVYMQSMGGFSR